MKNFYLAIFCALFMNAAFSQKTQNKLEQYYDYEWHVAKPPNVRYYSIVEKKDSGFLRQDYYLREKMMQMTGLYEDDSCKIQNGKFTFYYPSGKPAKQGEYVHGKKEGLWVEVYENGRWKDSTVYHNGRRIGTSMSYFENGNFKDSIVTDDMGFTIWISWFENGNLDRTGRFAMWNIPIQTWLYYHNNGQVASREKYNNGKLIKKEYYDENGSIMDTSNRDREAEYPGGATAWKKFLSKNLYFPSQYKIVNSDSAFTIVHFVVEPDGSMENVEVTVPFTKEFDNIVVNTIKKCKVKWLPAINHNRYVPFFQSQRVTFNQDH